MLRDIDLQVVYNILDQLAVSQNIFRPTSNVSKII